MNRKRIILAVLVAILGLCVLYAYIATPRLEKAPPRKAAQRVSPAAKVKLADQEKKVGDGLIDFAYLESDPQEFSGATRDIFNFGAERKPVIEAPPAPEPVVVIPEVVEPIMPELVAPVDVVNRALSQFTFVGFLEKAGEKTVFLSSSGEMFLVKSGEQFGADQEFTVESIEGNLLRVQHAGREGTIELQLIEQQKLNSAVSAPAQVAPRPAAPAQSRTRVFTPGKRRTRPLTPQRGNPFSEMNQENSPEEGTSFELPKNGDAIEGEVNGSNQ